MSENDWEWLVAGWMVGTALCGFVIAQTLTKIANVLPDVLKELRQLRQKL